MTTNSQLQMVEKVAASILLHGRAFQQFRIKGGSKMSALLCRIPQSSAPGFKMAYTHAKNAIRAPLEGIYDLNAVTKQEIIDVLGPSTSKDSESGSDFEDD